MHRIFIADDHALLRAGLRALVTSDPNLIVVGEADNGRDAVKLVATLLPELVLMDVSMPGMNGIEAIIDIKRRDPGIKVIVITIHKTAEYITASLKAGADGYMLKDASHDELKTAIRSVLQGKTYLSPDVSGAVIMGCLGGGAIVSGADQWGLLTHREREVIKLIAEGYTSKSIAQFYSLSVKTVEKHRSNMMKKLNLHNVSMVTTYAIARGLIEK